MYAPPRVHFEFPLGFPAFRKLIPYGTASTCDCRRAPDRRQRDIWNNHMATRHRCAAGTPRLRPCHVRLHLLAFLQSRARQHLVRRDGNVALVPHLVVEDSGRQFRALCRRDDTCWARFVGALSASAFSLHGRRNHSARIGAQHSTFDRQPSRSRARLRTVVRARTTELCRGIAHLLDLASAHARRCSSFY